MLGAQTQSPGFNFSAWRASWSGEETFEPLASAGDAAVIEQASKKAVAAWNFIAITPFECWDNSGLGRKLKGPPLRRDQHAQEHGDGAGDADLAFEPQADRRAADPDRGGEVGLGLV